MKIVLYSGAMTKDKDGVTKTLHELITTVKDAGHDLMLWNSEIQTGRICGLDVHQAPSFPFILYPDYRLGFYGPVIKSMLDKFDADVFHITTPDIIGYNFLKYARKRGIPVVSVYHTDFLSYLRYYHKILSRLLNDFGWKYGRWFYNRCDTVFVPTEIMRQKLHKRGIRNTKIWARGIHLDRYNPKFRSKHIRRKWGMEHKFVILYVGRFVWYKDLHVLISIYERIKNQGITDIGFIFVGSGPIEEELKKAMPEAVFPGYLVGKDLSEAYSSSDLLIHPSTTETFGNVLLEAMASGVPVIVADRGGCPEVVEKSGGGLIAKSWQIGSFMDCLDVMKNDQELYRQCRKSGLEFARKQSWEDMNSVILNEYSRLTRKSHLHD